MLSLNNIETTITTGTEKKVNASRAVTCSIFLVSGSCCGSDGLTSEFVSTAPAGGFDGLPSGFVVPPHFSSMASRNKGDSWARWTDHDELAEAIFTMLGHPKTDKYIKVSAEGWVTAASISRSFRGTRCAASVDDVVLAASASGKLALSPDRTLVRRAWRSETRWTR